MTFPMRRLAALAALAALGACSTETVNSPQAAPSLERAGGLANYATTNGLPQAGRVTVCSWHTPGTFTASASGAGLQTSSFSLGDVEVGATCEVVWQAPAGYAGGTTVTVTETTAGGSQPFRINVFGGATGTDGDAIYLPPTNSATVTMTPGLGIAIWFKNEPFEGGGNGCTPGYWKQKQHFGNWTAPYSPYTPGTTFQSAFGSNVFGSMTLLQVLGQGGGGINALGRHAAAALLNAAYAGAHSDLGFEMTTAQVIAQFNTAAASNNPLTIENEKNDFAQLNELGCPLARAE